jgi:hypothetical protein
MKIFILWIMLTNPKSMVLQSQEYTSLEACTSAEMQLHKDFTKAANWSDYSVSVMTSCTEK